MGVEQVLSRRSCAGAGAGACGPSMLQTEADLMSSRQGSPQGVVQGRTQMSRHIAQLSSASSAEMHVSLQQEWGSHRSKDSP